MKKIAFTLLIATLLTFTLSCCPCRKSSSAEQRNLAATTWQLTHLNGKSIPPVEGQYTLSLGEDGRVGGSALCNHITGSYSYTTDTRILKFDHMGMTRMICPEGGDFEDEYGKMLGSVTHFEVDGDQLIMLSKGDVVSLFRKL